MEQIKNIFDKIELKKWDCNKGKRYFDPIRKIFVNITPEEVVRQRMITFLINHMYVPTEYIHVEDHLAHFGIKNNKRIDIDITCVNKEGFEQPLAVIECKKESVAINAGQVLEQAYDYALSIRCKYFIIVNGVEIQFYHKEDELTYQPIKGILSYEDMLYDLHIESLPTIKFQRLKYEDYFAIERLKHESWYEYKIGEDIDEKLVPFIINLDDCLLDVSCQLEKIVSKNFSLIEDLGTEYRQYGDASGSNFGAGCYRLFLINDERTGKQFISGFSISATAKTINDPKYGSTDGKSVLVIIYNDGDVDEMSVQINLNRFLTINKEYCAHLTHNGSVTRHGANKKNLFDYLETWSKELIKNDRVDFGMTDYSVPLTLKNQDMILMLSKLIEYSVYRNEYKAQLSRRKN